VIVQIDKLNQLLMNKVETGLQLLGGRRGFNTSGRVRNCGNQARGISGNTLSTVLLLMSQKYSIRTRVNLVSGDIDNHRKHVIIKCSFVRSVGRL